MCRKAGAGGVFPLVGGMLGLLEDVVRPRSGSVVLPEEVGAKIFSNA